MSRPTQLLLLALGALTGILLLNGCSRGAAAGGSGGAEEGGAEQERTPTGVPVEVKAAELGSISRSLELTGTLEAEGTATVSARVSGELATVLVDVGDIVNAGDPLATIDAADIQIDLREAAGQVEQAGHSVALRRIGADEARSKLAKARQEEERSRADRDRQETLFQRNLVPEETVEQARIEQETRLLDVESSELAVKRADVDVLLEQARADNLQATLDRLRLREAYHTLRAPIDGVITSREIDPFDSTTVGGVAFRIMDLSTLVLELRVPEASIGLLRRRQAPDAGGEDSSHLYPAVLTTELRPGVEFEGWVSLISPVVDPGSGTVTVEVRVAASRGGAGGSEDPAAGAPTGSEPDTDHADLSPGMFTSCAIEVDRHDQVLLVPKRALIYDEGMPVVFVVDEDSRARRVPLRGRIGLDDEWNLEVEHPDLAPGSRVIVVGQSNLKGGSRIAVVEAEGEASPAAEPPGSPAQDNTAQEGTAGAAEPTGETEAEGDE